MIQNIKSFQIKTSFGFWFLDVKKKPDMGWLKLDLVVRGPRLDLLGSYTLHFGFS